MLQLDFTTRVPRFDPMQLPTDLVHLVYRAGPVKVYFQGGNTYGLKKTAAKITRAEAERVMGFMDAKTRAGCKVEVVKERKAA